MNRAAPHPQKKATCRAFHAVTLSGLLTLAIVPATAADFPGNLNGATISDAQTSNKPPTATFIYTQNGDKLTLNASGSSDPDGSITKYKWTFGDGTTIEGATATYTLTSTANILATLTVVDNSNGVALSQQTITPAAPEITDDFSSNTASNYTKAFGTGTLATTGGFAHITSTWQGRNVFYHNTSVGSADQHVYGTVENQAESSGIAFRINPTNQTCYIAYFSSSGYLVLRGFNLATGGWGKTELYSGGTYTQGARVLDITITGTTLLAKVDGVTAISTTISEYLTGDYAGFIIYRDATDGRVYDFGAE